MTESAEVIDVEDTFIILYKGNLHRLKWRGVNKPEIGGFIPLNLIRDGWRSSGSGYFLRHKVVQKVGWKFKNVYYSEY